MPVKFSAIAKHFVAVAAIVAASLLARPAAAQFSLGSPGGPPRLELGAGAFDITPNHRKDSGTQGVFRGEYHFGDMLWIISPMVGLDVTTSGGTYLYGGFGFDINFTPNWVLTPNGAVGWYQHGSGTVLGSWFEFRTGAELDYKFDDQSRLGIAFHHTSNAGLTKVNPGEQSVLLVYQMPLHW
jgi:lipid A 3-O-deacylase